MLQSNSAVNFGGSSSVLVSRVHHHCSYEPGTCMVASCGRVSKHITAQARFAVHAKSKSTIWHRPSGVNPSGPLDLLESTLLAHFSFVARPAHIQELKSGVKWLVVVALRQREVAADNRTLAAACLSFQLHGSGIAGPT